MKRVLRRWDEFGSRSWEHADLDPASVAEQIAAGDYVYSPPMPPDGTGRERCPDLGPLRLMLSSRGFELCSVGAFYFEVRHGR